MNNVDKGNLVKKRTSKDFLKSVFSPVDFIDEKDRIALLSLIAYMGFISGILLGIHDIILKYPAYGGPPFLYSLITLVTYIYYKRTSKQKVFIIAQLFSILFLPFIGQLLHGGFILSGSTIIWSFAAPICAVLFFGPARSIAWFFGYLILMIVATLLDGSISKHDWFSHIQPHSWYFPAHILGISFVIFTLILFFVYRLRQERKRSEKLLLNILPTSIASRLKEGETQIADAFSDATILFADIAGFTKMSSQMNPEDMVSMLNKVFSAFDVLSDKHNLEKIKTIGDAYMVVGGIPESNSKHVDDVLQMALEMVKLVKEVNKELNTSLEVRIGINCGPVVAGVIGIRKFIYDLWGDSVNVASRMESTGVKGKIQVTQKVYEAAHEKFAFTKRGKIGVKGKGEMLTYFLDGKKSV